MCFLQKRLREDAVFLLAIFHAGVREEDVDRPQRLRLQQGGDQVEVRPREHDILKPQIRSPSHRPVQRLDVQVHPDEVRAGAAPGLRAQKLARSAASFQLQRRVIGEQGSGGEARQFLRFVVEPVSRQPQQVLAPGCLVRGVDLHPAKLSARHTRRN